MELKIKTEELQSMVNRVYQCVSNNKLVSMTSLISIGVRYGHLVLTTTNDTNYYCVFSTSTVDCDDEEVCVDADLFTKLIQKTTAEEVTLVISDGILKVVGNGTYTIEIEIDDNGTVKFPKIYDMKGDKEVGEVSLQKIKDIISSNKASLGGAEFPISQYYYCKDVVATTNKKNVCCNETKMFEEPLIISNVTMELLSTVSCDTIKVYKDENDSTLFLTDKETIYAPIKDEAKVDDFPIVGIQNLINSGFTSSFKISRIELLNLLERLVLFVNVYDKKGIDLVVSEDGLIVSNKKSSGTEIIKYIDSKDFAPFSCCINVELLKNQLASLKSEVIEFYYGSKIAIKLKDDNITLLVALFNEEGK